MEGYVRITAGIYKGHKLKTPGGAVHPMGERERLALFNMIGNDLSEIRALDAYAGSGALGCEALSRGAGFVAFVEKNAAAARIIAANVGQLRPARRDDDNCPIRLIGHDDGDSQLRLTRRGGDKEYPPAAEQDITLRRVGNTIPFQVFMEDARKFESSDEYELIFVDPPYDNFELDGVRHLIQFLANDGRLVLSHPGETPDLSGLVLEKDRKYTGAGIAIYKKPQ